MEIAEKIREGRIKKGLTQREVAAALGKVPATVSAWEKGVALPRLATWEGLGKVLKK